MTHQHEKTARAPMEMPWYKAFEAVEPYVVSITTPQGSGTGFLVYQTDEQGLLSIATAAHVIEYSYWWRQPIRIQHFKSGETIFLNADDRFIEINKERDTACIVFPGGKLPFPKAKLPLIKEEYRLKVGVEIGWVGFPAIAPHNLCFFSGSISCWIEEEGFYFVDGVTINGVSGGPAITAETSNMVGIIGLVSAYIPNRATGEQLPGLCVVRDIFPLYETIKKLKSLDEAKKEAKPPELPPPPYTTPPGEETRA